MTKDDRHSTASADIDDYLSDYDFNDIARTPQNKYQAWYAVTLTGLALLAAGQKIVYAESRFEDPPTKMQIVVLTDALTIVAIVDLTTDSIPLLRAVSRASLSRLEIEPFERIDPPDSRSHAWPGKLLLRLNYVDLDTSIELVPANRGSRTISPDAIVELIQGLVSDLASGS